MENNSDKIGKDRELEALYYYKMMQRQGHYKPGLEIRLSTITEDALGCDIVIENKQQKLVNKIIQVKGIGLLNDEVKLLKYLSRYLNHIKNPNYKYEIYFSPVDRFGVNNKKSLIYNKRKLIKVYDELSKKYKKKEVKDE